MASDVYAFDATIPAGTPQAAPAVISMTMPPRRIERVEIMVPPGASGAVGFNLATGGIVMIPRGGAAFIVASPGTLDWALENQITSGQWQMQAYNTGSYTHYLQVRFFTSLLPSASGDAPPPLSNEALSVPPTVYTITDNGPVLSSGIGGQV